MNLQNLKRKKNIGPSWAILSNPGSKVHKKTLNCNLCGIQLVKIDIAIEA